MAGDTGDRTRQVVLEVLNAGNVKTTDVGNGDYKLEGNNRMEVVYLPEVCGRNLISSLSNKYAVLVEWFYHPELAEAKRRKG